MKVLLTMTHYNVYNIWHYSRVKDGLKIVCYNCLVPVLKLITCSFTLLFQELVNLIRWEFSEYLLASFT